MTTPTTEQQTATEFKGVLEIKRTLIAGAKFELTGTALSERWFKAVKQYQLLNGLPSIKESISSAMFQAGFATSETAKKRKDVDTAKTCADYDIQDGFVFVKPDAPLGKSTLERWNSNMVSIEKGARGGKLEATPMSKFDSFSQVQAFYKSVPAGSASKKEAEPKQPASNEATIDDILKYVEKFSSKTMRDFVEMRMRADSFEGLKMDVQLADFMTGPTEETVTDSDSESDAIDVESEIVRELETVFSLTH